MGRISSRQTLWHKKIVPTLIFGMTAAFCVLLGRDVANGRLPVAIFVVPVIVVGPFYLLLRWLVFRLMDEVWIDGDDLIVRNRGEEARVPIASITNVSGSFLVNPEHVRLTLSPPSIFGGTIRFMPPMRFLRLGLPPVAQELADRSGCFDRRRYD
jgi:hypothetical protein